MPVTSSSYTVQPAVQSIRKNACVGNSDTTTKYESYTCTKTRTTSPNRVGWRHRIKTHQSATTSLIGTEELVEFSPGYVWSEKWDTQCAPKRHAKYTWDGYVCRFTPAIDNPVDPLSLAETAANSDALTKYLSEIHKAQADFQSGIFFGEIGQTLRMIRSPAKLLRQGLTKYSEHLKLHARWFRRKPKAFVQFAGDTWLEYAFGWRPLMGDLDGGAKALARIATQSRVLIRHVASEGQESSSSNSSVRSQTYDQVLMNWKIRRELECIVSYLGVLKMAPASTVKMQTLGVTLQEFVPTLWELTPFSFLVDYFANVGEVIDGWSAQLGNLAWTNKTVIRTSSSRICDQTVTIQPISGKFITAGAFPGQGVRTKRNVNRTAYPGNLIPGFHFRIPGLSDWRKWTNMSALAVTNRRTARIVMRL